MQEKSPGIVARVWITVQLFLFLCVCVRARVHVLAYPKCYAKEKK
jgi:hypothetical protein